MRHRDDEVYRRIVRAYLGARSKHLLGQPDLEAYRAIATDESVQNDDRAAELAAAALRFADME